MAKPLIVLVYCFGRMCEGEDGIMYESPRPKSMMIKHDTTLEHLKRRIHSKLRLQANQSVSSVVYRYPHWSNVFKWIALPLEEDEDVACMINCYQQYPNLSAMEVFVEVETGDNDMNVEVPSQTECYAGPSGFGGSSQLLNTQSSMAHVDPLVEARVIDVSQCPKGRSFQFDLENEEPEIRDTISDESEDEGELPEDDDDADTDIEEEFEATDLNIPEQPPPLNIAPQTAFRPPCPQFSEINWDALTPQDEYVDLQSSGYWSAEQELYVGLQFPSKDAVKLALRQYSIRRHQSYRVQDSDSVRLTAKCPRFGDTCNWRVRAILSKRSGTWQIVKYNGPHTCVNQALSQDHQKLNSAMICSCILEMVRQKPEVPTCLIIERIQSQFGYTVSYRKAWKAKQLAIVKVFGDWDKSYEMLPR